MRDGLADHSWRILRGRNGQVNQSGGSMWRREKRLHPLFQGNLDPWGRGSALASRVGWGRARESRVEPAAGSMSANAWFRQLRRNDFDSRQCVIGHNSGNFFSIP